MLAIVNARLITVADGIIENGAVLLKDKRIVSLGRDIAIPDNCRKIDAIGRPVTPGLIDAHTHAGISEHGIDWAGNDTNEGTNPVNPFCRVKDGINMKDRAFDKLRKAGITCIGVLPGSSNILGGAGLALKCTGIIVDEAIVKDPIGIKAALGENPKKCYGKNNQSPATRMGNAAVLRESLLKAKQYLEKKQSSKEPALDMKWEALLPVIKKEIPLFIHCHRHDDIVTAVRICREFDVRFALEHVTDGHLIADFLKKHQVHCAVGPTLYYGSKVENRDRSFKTPVQFDRKKIPFCFITDHPVVDARNLALTAGMAVQWGMSEESALRAITLGSAEHIGINDRVGSLEAGKDADLVIWSGNPLEFTSFADMTIINGDTVYERGNRPCY